MQVCPHHAPSAPCSDVDGSTSANQNPAAIVRLNVGIDYGQGLNGALTLGVMSEVSRTGTLLPLDNTVVVYACATHTDRTVTASERINFFILTDFLLLHYR